MWNIKEDIRWYWIIFLIEKTFLATVVQVNLTVLENMCSALSNTLSSNNRMLGRSRSLSSLQLCGNNTQYTPWTRVTWADKCVALLASLVGIPDLNSRRRPSGAFGATLDRFYHYMICFPYRENHIKKLTIHYLLLINLFGIYFRRDFLLCDISIVFRFARQNTFLKLFRGDIPLYRQKHNGLHLDL